mgnify:CR=1 FL=1
MKNDTTTTAAKLTLEQKNANARRDAMTAAKNAVIALYANDRIAFLHACLFDKNDRAYTQIVEYTAEKNDGGTLVPFTASARLHVTLFDFVTKKNDRAALNDRIEMITEKASECGKAAYSAAVPLVQTACTHLGLHACGTQVNERDVKRILRAAYSVTDKNDDTARKNECKRAILAMLWSMTENHESINVYRAERAAKAAAAAEKAAQRINSCYETIKDTAIVQAVEKGEYGWQLAA